MSNITTKIETTYGFRITGYVDGRDIVSVGFNERFGGEQWQVGMSSCLPVNMKKAQEYIDCMNLVFKEAEKHGYKKEPQ